MSKAPSAGLSLPFVLGDSLFAAAIDEARAQRDRPLLVGLCGSQGSGKSTTAARLCGLLLSRSVRSVVCSLDDFYLTQAERQRLARTIHPLLATRGVPGTHDLTLMTETLNALLQASADSVTTLPIFDKSRDDRLPVEEWSCFEGRPEVVILEGWCVGARPQDEDALTAPVNVLEARDDPGGCWRAYVNTCLRRDYAPLFDALDLRLMLRAPSFECVHGWRAEQEAGLRPNGRSAAQICEAQLARFIAHFERITRWLMQDEPADLIADLDEQRRPFRWRTSIAADRR